MQRIIHQRQFSKKRIQKIAEEIIANEKEELKIIPGLDVVQNNSARPIVRAVWFLIIASCFCTCVYQVGSRIEYWLSDPTVVDVFFEELSAGKMPRLMLSTRDTEAYMQYLKKKPLPKPRRCFANVNEIIGLNNTGLGLEEIWNMVNTTTIIKDAYLEKNGRRIANLSLSDYNGVGGVCTDIFYDEDVEHRDSSLKMRVKLTYPSMDNDSCQTPLIVATIQSGEEKTFDLSSVIFFAVHRKTMIAISVKKYTYLNTTKRPCVNRKTYEDCETGCYQSLYLRAASRCRFPFTQNKSMEYCVPSEETLQDYTRITDSLSEFNPRRLCNCPSPCSKIQQTNMMRNDITSSELIELYIESGTARAMNERYAYGALPLLCDIGGNLGLYLGLSILSAAQLMSHYARFLRQKKATPIWKKNVLYRKVYLVLRAEKKKNEKYKDNKTLETRFHQLHDVQRSKCRIKSYFNYSVNAIAIILCLYQTCDRIAYFFKYPILVSTDVVEDNIIQLPSIVTCFLTTKIFEDKKPLGENLNYTCDTNDFLHFLDPPYIYANNANKLWEDSSTIESHEKSYFGDLKPFPTIFGNCTEASKGLLQYSPLISIMYSMLPRTVDCGCSYKIFIIPPGKKLNLKNYIDIPCAGQSNTKFVRQTLIKLNIPKKPCMSLDEVNLCEENCYKNKMITNITCKLPFMTNVSLPICTSAKSANYTRSVYFNAYMNTDPIKECSCQQCCNETIFLAYTTYDDASFSSSSCSSSYGLQGNLREIIQQNRAFTLIKLLCDVGSNLGVMLGMSMLSLIHLTQKTIYSSTLVIKSYGGKY